MKSNTTNLQDKMAQAFATGKVGNHKVSLVQVPRIIIESYGKTHAFDLCNGADDNGSQARLDTLATALCHPLATTVDAEYIVVDVGTRQSVRHTLRTSLTGCTQTTTLEGALNSEMLDRHAAALEEKTPEEVAGLATASEKKSVRLYNWTDPATTGVDKSDKDGQGFDRRLEYEFCVFYLNSTTGAWKMVKKANVAEVYAPLQGIAIPHDITNEELLAALAHAPACEPEKAHRYITHRRVANPQVLNR